MRLRPVVSTGLAGALLAFGSAARAELRVAPSAQGYFGAWLAASPIGSGPKGGKAHVGLDAPVAPGGDDGAVVGQLGRSVAGAPFRIVSAAEGPIDLGKVDGEALALVSGTLRLEAPIDGALLLGASDGVRVYVDGKAVFSRDERRSEWDDEIVVPLRLDAGEHAIVLKLRHREGAWSFRPRIVDGSLAPPRGAVLVLPGGTGDDARALAGKMATLTIDRGLRADGWHPRVTARYPGGVPLDVERGLRVSARIKGSDAPLFEVNAGEVPLSETGPTPLEASLPAILPEDVGEAEVAGEVSLSIDVAGRTLDVALHLRRALREGVAAADRALALCDAPKSPFLSDPAATRATIEHLRERLVGYFGRGDNDLDALGADARTLVEYLADLEQQRDPLRSHAGIRRFALRSALDGEPSPFGVYVPPSYKPGSDKTYPLVVALHGMNGKPLSMIRWFFAKDDEAHDSEWEDRHPGEVAPIDAFVVAPNAHGNAMYRELGEVDVMAVLDWAEKFFPVDRRRVSITGVSMGGIGSASIPLRHPDRFAAAAPLCGYHSYFIRRDLSGRALRPWEKLIAEHRSNVLWAENGLHVPMYVWHGKRDLPEENSGVLIDRYKALGYRIADEHPDVGHDVWKKAYDELKGYRWLAQYKRPEHPGRVVFKTDSLRYADDAWVHVRELETPMSFGEIRASVKAKDEIEVATKGVSSLALDRDPERVSKDGALRVRIDGETLTFGADEPVAAHKEGAHWRAGAAASMVGEKRPGLSGPMRDVFLEPLVFVYGTGDPAQTRANQEVAQKLAQVRFGVDVKYPIVADVDVDDATASTHALVLVGNARSNRVLAAIEPGLPFRVEGGEIVAGAKRWRGDELGVAFVHPNPAHPDRYVLVVEGATPLGTLRATSLPDLLPDYIVYDRSLAPARGQLVLGSATPLAAGLFDRSWKLPAE